MFIVRGVKCMYRLNLVSAYILKRLEKEARRMEFDVSRFEEYREATAWKQRGQTVFLKTCGILIPP